MNTNAFFIHLAASSL